MYIENDGDILMEHIMMGYFYDQTCYMGDDADNTARTSFHDMTVILFITFEIPNNLQKFGGDGNPTDKE